MTVNIPLVVGDGQKFNRQLRERLSQFGLTLHEEKTRLIEFGRLWGPRISPSFNRSLTSLGSIASAAGSIRRQPEQRPACYL